MLDGFTPIPPDFAKRYRDKGYWLDQTMGQYFGDCFRRYAERIAMVAGVERVTYGELGARVDRLAGNLIGLGIEPLDRFIVQLPNCPEFVYLYFALLRIGAIPLMALPRHRKYEIGHFAEFADAVGYAAADRAGNFSFVDMAGEIRGAQPGLRHLLILGDGVPDGCTDLAALIGAEPKVSAAELDALEIDPDWPAVFQLSGGTTGMPKIIPRTHNDYILNSVGCATANDIGADDVLLVALPIGHNFPLASPGIQGFLLNGGRIVLAASPQAADILPLIEAERITHLELVPAVLVRLIHDKTLGDYDLSSVRIVNTGGQRLQPETSQRTEEMMPHAIVQEVFGMAEGLVMMNRLDDPAQLRHDTVGPSWCADDEIRLLDDDGREVADGEIGELAVRGPYTLRGYYRLAEHNAQSFTDDGFFLTGDLLRRHPSGTYVVEGRKKDLINRGGEKISAEEVENLMLGHPAVLNVACVPMPDPVLGERSCAYVIPAPGAAPTLADLTTYLDQQGLARFKFPERLEIVDRFPLSPVGKVSKKDLMEIIAKKVAEEDTSGC